MNSIFAFIIKHRRLILSLIIALMYSISTFHFYFLSADNSYYLNFSEISHCGGFRVFSDRSYFDFLIACFILTTAMNGIALFHMPRRPVLRSRRFIYLNVINNIAFFSLTSIFVLFSMMRFMNILFSSMAGELSVNLEELLNNVFTLLVIVFFLNSVTLLRRVYRQHFLRWSSISCLAIIALALALNTIKYDTARIEAIYKSKNPIYAESYLTFKTDLKGRSLSKSNFHRPLYIQGNKLENFTYFCDSDQAKNDIKDIYQCFHTDRSIRRYPILYMTDNLKMKDFISIVYSINTNGRLSYPLRSKDGYCSQRYVADKIWIDEELYEHLMSALVPNIAALPPVPPLGEYTLEHNVYELKQNHLNQIVFRDTVISKALLIQKLEALNFPNDSTIIEIKPHPEALFDSFVQMKIALREVSAAKHDIISQKLYTTSYNNLYSVEERLSVRRLAPYKAIEVYDEDWYK